MEVFVIGVHIIGFAFEVFVAIIGIVDANFDITIFGMLEVKANVGRGCFGRFDDKEIVIAEGNGIYVLLPGGRNEGGGDDFGLNPDVFEGPGVNGKNVYKKTNG